MLVKTQSIILTAEEQSLARFIAKKRTDANKQAKTHHNWGEVDPYEIDLIGFGAELAFASVANVYPDLTTEVRKGTPDFIFGRGYKGDVKWTGMVNPHLLVKKEKKAVDPADLYVLMIGDYPIYELIGFALGEQVFNSRITNYGFGDNYTVYIEELLKEFEL